MDFHIKNHVAVDRVTPLAFFTGRNRVGAGGGVRHGSQREKKLGQYLPQVGNEDSECSGGKSGETETNPEKNLKTE